MKQITKRPLNKTIILATAILLVTSHHQSEAVGNDVAWSQVKFKKNYGDNLYSKKTVPGLNVFVGNMFNDNFGAEIGYEINKKSKKENARVNPGEQASGAVI